MKCGFCGSEFNIDESKQGCCGCAMNGCCKKYKCPRCGYEILPETGLMRLIRKWRKKT